MAEFLDFALFENELEKPIKGSHVIYDNVSYPTADGNKFFYYKENKHRKPILSCLEVSFSALAQRFLQPNLTAQQYLVKRNESVLGVGSFHLQYSAFQREQDARIKREQQNEESAVAFIEEGHTFCIAEKNALTDTYTFIPNPINADVPSIFFLNKFSPSLFQQLLADYYAGKIVIDMASLASVLATSYFLEEDDLHKGNIAFYVSWRDDKPYVVFQKIDHDLMLSDSIMSRMSSRASNWLYDEHAFDILAEDIENFPFLHFSKNHYWPTTLRHPLFPSPYKQYLDSQEREAFISLRTDPDFVKAKWQAFYKHILIPAELIRHDLEKVNNMDNPVERSRVAMIVQSAIERQAKLRSVLFSIPEFRSYVSGLSENDRKDMADEIAYGVELPENKRFSDLVHADLKKHQDVINDNVIQPGDTPLHVAIRMGDYRYNETCKMFSRYLNTPNHLKEKPLDVVVNRINNDETITTRCLSNNILAIAKHLSKHAVKTPAYLGLDNSKKEAIYSQNYASVYLAKLSSITNAKQLVKLISKLGEDTRYDLKMKKDIAIEVVSRYIQVNKNNPDLKVILTTFRNELNGNPSKHKAINPGLFFIHQLRSNFWFIRILRGLYGKTSTLVDLNSVIDKGLAKTPKPAYAGTLFANHHESRAIPDLMPPPYVTVLA